MKTAVMTLGRITALVFLALIASVANADIDTSQTGSDAQTTSTNRTILTQELYDELNSGDIFAGLSDRQTEVNIAKTELALAQNYLNDGQRKMAIILGILARKSMQRVVNNPYDPSMIPIYSILVQLYQSPYDRDTPNVDASDAKKAKMYREAIDHIHAR